MPQAGGATGWVLVHKTKGVMWNSLDLQEDRPGGLWAKLNGWKWQRVLISFDAHDDPFPMADAAQPQQETAPLRLCGYCKSWNSKPCGEGCCWSPTDPTIEKVRADDLKAKQKHNRKHPLPVTFER